MGRFGDIINKLGALPSRQGLVTEFSPVQQRQGDNAVAQALPAPSVWRDMVNVRYKGEGIRQDAYVRGGSEAGASTDVYDFVHAIAFTSAYEGTTTDYLLKQSTDTLHLYNITDSGYTSLGSPASLGYGSEKLEHVLVGRFLYLFDPSNGKAWYIDIKEQEIFAWNRAEPGALSYDTVSAYTGDNEENVFGIQEGSSVYVYVDDFEWYTSVNLYTEFRDNGRIPKGIYKYVYNSAIYATIGGIDYKTDTLLVIEEETTFTVTGTGATPTIYDGYYGSRYIPYIDGEITYAPQLTKIKKLDVGTTDENVGFTLPWSSNTHSNSDTLFCDADTRVKFYPAGPDLTTFLENSGKYVVDTDDITEDETFVSPYIYRAYCIVYELRDGSFTQPGVPTIIRFDTTGLINLSYELAWRGFVFTHSPTEAPDDAVRGYLFCTRWQFNEESCYGASEAYPTSPFFLSRTFSVTETSITDTTPDSKLLTGIGSFVPHADGKPTTFPAGALNPHHIAGAEGSLILGSCTLSRPTPTITTSTVPNTDILITASGSFVSDLYLVVWYEYSDGSFSDMFESGAGQLRDSSFVYSQRALPALIKAVHLYLKDDSGAPDYYLVQVLDDTDPEWYGKELTISDDVADYTLSTPPSGSTENETVVLENYIALATPGQMIDIASLKPVNTVERIERVFCTYLDSARADTLRYQIYILTNREPVLVYMNADLSEGAFDVTDERIGRVLPLKAPFACAPFAGGIIFQSLTGIYFWQGKTAERLIADTRYDLLTGDILDVAFHPREPELWLLGENNRVLVLRDAQNSTSPGGETPAMVYEMDYSNVTGKTFSCMATLGTTLYGTFDEFLVKLDVEGLLSDSGTGSSYAMSGVLTSDYLGSVYEQLLLEQLELTGTGLSATMEVDLQDHRYAGNGSGWSADFGNDAQHGPVTLSMDGVFFPVNERGFQPRLKITLTPASGQRLVSALLRYRSLPLAREIT